MKGPGGKWYNSPVTADREDRQSWIPRPITTNRKSKLFFGKDDFIYPIAYQQPVQQRAAPYGEADAGAKKLHPWMHPSYGTKEVPERILPDWMSPNPRRGTRDQDSFGGGRPGWMNPPATTFKGTQGGVPGQERPGLMEPSKIFNVTQGVCRGDLPNWLLPSATIPKGTQAVAAENRPTCKSKSTTIFRGAKEATEGGSARTGLLPPSTKTLKDTQVETGGERPIRTSTAPSDSSMRGTKDGVRLDIPFWLPPPGATSKVGTHEKTGGGRTSLLYPSSATSRGSPKDKRGDKSGSFSPFYTMGGAHDVTGGDRPDWMIPSAVPSSTQTVSEGERPGWMIPSATQKGTHFPRRTVFGGPKKFFPPPKQENVPCPGPSTLGRFRSPIERAPVQNTSCFGKRKAPKKSQGVVQHQQQKPTQGPQKAIPSSKPTTLKTKQQKRKAVAVAEKRPLPAKTSTPAANLSQAAPFKDSSSIPPAASSSKKGTCAML